MEIESARNQKSGLAELSVSVEDLKTAGGFYWAIHMSNEDPDLKNYQDTEFMLEKIRGLCKQLVNSIFTNNTRSMPRTNFHELHAFDYELWGYTHRIQPVETPSPKERETLRQNFDRVLNWLTILQESISAWENNQILLKRQIYYKHIDQFSSQTHSDSAINAIAYHLKIPRYGLKIGAAGKGIVASRNLEIFTVNDPDQIIDVGFMTQTQDGFVIKNSLNLGVTNLEHIEFVLVVEKETVYSELIESGYFQHQFFANSVLVTGKGYPDFNTKYLLRKIFEGDPKIPFFYLGDGDPHGYEILFSYLFGSQTSAYDHTNLPVIWPIGVDFSDFQNAGGSDMVEKLEKLELSDHWKIMEMLKREYFNFYENLGVGENWDESKKTFEMCQVKKLSQVENNLRNVMASGRKAEVEDLKLLGVGLLEYAMIKIKQLL